ncbi:sensor histidine kinase [Cellulomonas hominis]
MTRSPTTRLRLTETVRALDSVTRGGAPNLPQGLTTAFWLAAMITTSSVRTGRFELPGTTLWLATVGAWAPLLVRTYRPLLALVGTVVAESVILTYLAVPDPIAQSTGGMGAYQPVPLATILAAATLASRTPRRTGWVVGLAAGGVLMVVGLTTQSTDTYLTDLVVFYLVVTAAALGVWLSGRLERAERVALEREAHAQRAVLDERLRIARELHDVLAHNLTLVNAQAGVARYLLRTDIDAAEQALRDITRHTGRAIDELGATIGLLRRQEEGDDDSTAQTGQALRPVPGLGALDELVGSFLLAGTDVQLTTTGTPGQLAQHADLAAYRILQEALTNAAKHAPGATIEVGLTWTGAGVRLRVANRARSRAAQSAAPGTGNGLIGMRERAGAAGGTLRAGPTSDGGFEVVATLPNQPAGTDGSPPAGPAHHQPTGDPHR